MILLTLGAHAQEGYCSCPCLAVWLFVCVSFKSHLTSGASLCPENTVTYSAGNSEIVYYQRVTTSFHMLKMRCK